MIRDEEAEKRLINLLKPLDIPDHRRSHLSDGNLDWMIRNIAIRNAMHKDFDEVFGLLRHIRFGSPKEKVTT